jgi:hypothetical protein
VAREGGRLTRASATAQMVSPEAYDSTTTRTYRHKRQRTKSTDADILQTSLDGNLGPQSSVTQNTLVTNYEAMGEPSNGQALNEVTQESEELIDAVAAATSELSQEMGTNEQIQAEAIAQAALIAQGIDDQSTEDQTMQDYDNDESSLDDSDDGDDNGQRNTFGLDFSTQPSDPNQLALWLAQQLSNGQLYNRARAFQMQHEFLSAADREKVREENRNRKKRWRQSNIDRNKDNDLRCRINKRAKNIFGSATSSAKTAWMEAEFNKRKAKRETKEKNRTEYSGFHPNFRSDLGSGMMSSDSNSGLLDQTNAAASLLANALLGASNENSSTADVANALKTALENGVLDPQPFTEALKALAANPDIMKAMNSLLQGDSDLDDGMDANEQEGESIQGTESVEGIENQDMNENLQVEIETGEDKVDNHLDLGAFDFNDIINKVSSKVIEENRNRQAADDTENEQTPNPFDGADIPDVINDVVQQILSQSGTATSTSGRRERLGSKNMPDGFKRTRYSTHMAANGFDPATMDINSLLDMGKSVNAVIPLTHSQAIASELMRGAAAHASTFARGPLIDPVHASSFGSTGAMNELLRQRPNAYSRPLLNKNTAPTRPAPVIPVAERMKKEAEEKKARAFGFPPRPGQILGRRRVEGSSADQSSPSPGPAVSGGTNPQSSAVGTVGGA